MLHFCPQNNFGSEIIQLTHMISRVNSSSKFLRSGRGRGRGERENTILGGRRGKGETPRKNKAEEGERKEREKGERERAEENQRENRETATFLPPKKQLISTRKLHQFQPRNYTNLYSEITPFQRRSPRPLGELFCHCWTKPTAA